MTIDGTCLLRLRMPSTARAASDFAAQQFRSGFGARLGQERKHFGTAFDRAGFHAVRTVTDAMLCQVLVVGRNQHLERRGTQQQRRNPASGATASRGVAATTPGLSP